MERILNEYEEFLATAPFEVLHTKKLGWIVVRADYQAYSDPIKQVGSPEELREYIEFQMSVSE